MSWAWVTKAPGTSIRVIYSIGLPQEAAANPVGSAGVHVETHNAAAVVDAEGEHARGAGNIESGEAASLVTEKAVRRRPAAVCRMCPPSDPGC